MKRRPSTRCGEHTSAAADPGDPRWARATASRAFALITAVTVTASLVLSAGCASKKAEGDDGSRINIYRTTEADRDSQHAHAPSLWEFSDLVAESLISDLTHIDSIRRKPSRVVVEMGDLNNRTNTPTADFEAVQHRIRGKLHSSRLIRDHFMIVENATRIDREMERVAGENRGTALYDPEDTYLLMGSFYESGRPDTRRYYFEFNLVHLASREIIENWHYDLAQE